MTSERVHGALLVLVVAISIVVVTTVANPLPHLGGDNAGYVALAHDLVVNGSYTDVFDPERLPHTKYPPVFPGLLALLIAVGARTWVALKAVSAVATVTAVGFTYLWAARAFGAVTGFVIALLTAMSVGVVYYSQWVLSDTVFLAFTFAALYALARADRSGTGSHAAAGGEGDAAEGGPRVDGRWLGVAVLAAALAYLTRSAGLPLVLALLGWLALRRAWRPLALSGAVLGVPMLAWWLRGRSGGVAQYASEFWMVNPYDPSLGTVGARGLAGRVVENAVGYTVGHLPLGVVGSDAPMVPLLGLALVIASVFGWALRSRKRLGPAELFFPAYWGVVLLWPTVWSGDRFALPLLPLVFAYGALALRVATSRLPQAAGPTILTVAALTLLFPATQDWRRTVRESGSCPDELVRTDIWACYGPRVQSFMAAASWAGRALPEGSAVLSRKPRHFYVQSGVPSRAFAFFEDPEAHFELADRLRARYVLLDRWDAMASRYVGAAVTRRPAAFCFVRGFGRAQDGGAQLLGLLPPAARVPGDEEETTIELCPSDYAPIDPGSGTYASSGRIPLLEGLDS